MILLDRYIRKQVLGSVALVLLIMGGLDLLFALFDEVSQTNELYTMGNAAIFILLTIPRRIYDLLPLSSLFGALIGLGVLASSNELMVMQSAGIKVSRIVWSVMKPTLGIMVFSLLLGQFVVPALEVRAELGKAMANGQEAMLSPNGYWLKDGRQFLHANAIEPGGILHGISLFEYDDDNQPMHNYTASKATFIGEQEGSNLWRLEDVTSFTFSSAGNDGLTGLSRYSVSEEVSLELNPELMDVLILDADNMAISDIYRYASYYESQGQDAGSYYLSFWKKLFQPLTTAVLVLVAISFIFGPLRSATMGSRLFSAICFGLLFIMLQRFLNTLSLVYQIEPMLAVLFPIVLSACAGFWLLKRAA